MSTRLGRRTRAAALAALSAAALALTGCTGSADPLGDASVNTVDGALAEGIEAAVQNALTLSGSTAAVVGVWQGDSAYVQGYGDGITANAPIRAAQASQPVMCALLLDLVDQGELTLDRAVSEDLPRQVGIEGVTYGQLCRATSGLADFTGGLTDIFANNPTRPWAERELLSQGLARSPLSWPGRDVHPADTNALLLARALRIATQQSLPELLETRVFSPAGMPSSSYPEDPQTETELPGGGMTGTTWPFAGGAPRCDVEQLDATEVAPAMLAGAGATITTVTDLKNFYESYLGGGFGGDSAGVVTEVTATANPIRDADGNPVAEGEEAAAAIAAAEDPNGQKWGFGLEKVAGLYGMSGSMTGTLTASYRDPETGVSVVVALNNSTAGSGFARALAFQLAALAGAGVPWSAEDQAANLASLAVCQPAVEEPAAE